MAAWHYTREGELFGPYSEEAMAEQIKNGEIDSETLVRDADRESDVEEWFYVRDSALAPYLPDYVPPVDPPEETAPAPEPESKPKPVRAKFQVKKLLPVAVILVVFIIGIIVGVGSSMLTR